jgi:uncharacterized membrane protein YtjA (UPF0391 family)
MLQWLVIFLIISIVAGALGFSGVSAMAEGAAEMIFFFFLVLFFIALCVFLLHPILVI